MALLLIRAHKRDIRQLSKTLYLLNSTLYNFRSYYEHILRKEPKLLTLYKATNIDYFLPSGSLPMSQPISYNHLLCYLG